MTKEIKEVKQIQVKFNKAMRNKNITPKMLQEVYDNYLNEVQEQHGRKIALPFEQQTVMALVEDKYKAPYVFLPNIIYNLSEDDAKYYTSLTERVLDPKLNGKYFADVENDKPRYMVDYHIAERV
jgi:hypothetical protein